MWVDEYNTGKSDTVALFNGPGIDLGDARFPHFHRGCSSPVILCSNNLPVRPAKESFTLLDDDKITVVNESKAYPNCSFIYSTACDTTQRAFMQ